MPTIRTCKFLECDYKNKKVARMRLHEQMHSNDPEVQRPYKCDKCAYRGLTAVHLKNHVVVHSDETPYACHVIGCGFRTKNKRRLLNHEKCKHSLEKPIHQSFKCTIERCEFKTMARQNLEQHVLNCHTDRWERRIECPLCSHKFFSVLRMKSHLQTHTKEKPWKCSFCSFEGQTKTNLNRHCESLHGRVSVSNEQALHQCNLCEFKTKFLDRLKSHLTLHSDERPYSCTYPGCIFRAKTNNTAKNHETLKHFPEHHPCAQLGCNYVGKSRRLLTQHCRNIHVSPFGCLVPNCNRGFSTEVALLNHQRFHDPKRLYQCDVCEKRYDTKSGVGTHIRTVHPKTRRFRCHSCDYSAKRGRNLRTHIEKIHKTGLTECKEDGCTFKSCSPHDIMQHNRRHNFNDRFKCEHCDLRYSSKYILLAHWRKSCSVRKQERLECANLETQTTVSANSVPVINLDVFREQKARNNYALTVVLTRISIDYR